MGIDALGIAFVTAISSVRWNRYPVRQTPFLQQQWLDSLQPYIVASQAGKCRLLFSDAVHFTLSAFVCNVWSRERVYLKTAAGRNRQNVLGAVDAVTKEVFSVENKLISQRKRWKCSAKTQGHDTRYTDSGCEGSGESRAVTGT